jgi:hypothetical protein
MKKVKFKSYTAFYFLDVYNNAHKFRKRKKKDPNKIFQNKYQFIMWPCRSDVYSETFVRIWAQKVKVC